jgi:hypothetical protein
MTGIFISYRRIDSRVYAGRLFDRLARHFGPSVLFMDIEGGISRGADFVNAIGRAVADVDAMVVVIGHHWSKCTDDQGLRRLDSEDDWVRQEIVAALRRDILVLPVLVGGATMPRAEDLPDDIRALARKQAAEISDSRWDYDTVVKPGSDAQRPRSARVLLDVGRHGSPDCCDLRVRLFRPTKTWRLRRERRSAAGQNLPFSS